MFKDTKTFFSFSVNDLQKAKQFYTEVLGLSASDTPEGLSIELAGGGRLFIYNKGPRHQAASFTVLNFIVDDVDRAVADLKSRGVQFEIYDGPDIKTDAQGIARGGDRGPTIAWFKDPAGNVLSVLESPT